MFVNAASYIANNYYYRFAFVDGYQPTGDPATNVYWAQLTTAAVADLGE